LKASRKQLHLLLSLVRAYSPSGRERPVAKVLLRWLTSQAVFERVLIDETGNVIAFHGPGPYLVLCGHMDTVPGKIDCGMVGNKLTGRGAVDAKAALGAMCLAATDSVKAGLTNIMFAAVVGEEGDGNGMRHLLSKKYVYSGAVFGEPTDDKIVVGYRGRLCLSVISRGKAAHASSPALGKNAILAAISFIEDLKRKVEGRGYTCTPTLIRGGMADNVVPARCEATIDIRVPIGFSLEDIEGLVRGMERDDIRINVTDRVPPVRTGRANALYRATCRALRLVGITPRAVTKFGSGDMNQFYVSTGVPCIALGPGDPSLSHTDKETIELEKYVQAINIYGLLIKEYFSILGPTS